jgi:hypothetical protein
MATLVLIIGESGTGKSRAIKTLNPKETFLIQTLDKPLPFRGWAENYIKATKENNGNVIVTDSSETIRTALKHIEKKLEIKNIVIDDFQYVMANEFIRRAKEKGYEKFTELAQNVWNILFDAQFCRQDLIIFFLSHSETDANGRTKFKTIGKMLDEKITIEGMFTVVLNTTVSDGVYKFATQNNGSNTSKSPEGMFETVEIENSLQLVADKIRSY